MSEADALRKLSPEAKRLLLSSDADEHEEVRVLIRVRGPVEDRRGDLASAGARIDSVAGDILTGRTTIGALTRLAELEGVVSVEISRPLSPEGG